MPDERFADHLHHPRGRGHELAQGHDGVAGGAACGDLVRLTVAVRGDRVADAGFEAAGCGATIAAASAAVELVRGAPLLEAARVGSPTVAAELGGLSAGKLHAADLAADALARALGAAVRSDGGVAASEHRTLVAMSGGVDSAVAAVLAKRLSRDAGGRRRPSRGAGSPPDGLPMPPASAAPSRGARHPRSGPLPPPSCLETASNGEVVAVTLELWRDPENDGERSCCSADAVRGARALAHGMGLAHLTIDLRDEFRAGVVQPWLDEHAAGLTPNPCVRCNGEVRLDAMLALADRVGAATLTTGHYARRSADGLLRLAADPAKDQAYMLAALGRDSLARLRFPLGELTKPEVRAIAREHDLPVAAKADSQDLCFLAGTGRRRFLERHGRLRDRPGDVVDRGGRRLARHDGAHLFTVGQRRGVGVGGSGEPLYVLGTDAGANTVTVGPRAALDTDAVRVRDLRLHRGPDAVDAVRLRYRAPAVPCVLAGDELCLARPARRPAPGQTAVLLAGDVVVGCATIDA